MLRIVTLVFSIFYSGLLLAQTQGLEDRPDVIASFPGGNDSLYVYLANRIIYPRDAIVRKVEGTVFVEFIVEKSGYINPQSIKTLRSLFPSIDNESIRLVKLFPRWIPALKDNVPVDSKYVLPIDFTLGKEVTVSKAEEALPFLNFNIRKPFSAIIKRKSAAAKSPDWNIYLQGDQIDVIGKVEPGVKVIVIDWDHNVYGISPSPGLSSSFTSGFISSSALVPNVSLDSIAEIVMRYRNPKHLQNIPKPLAHMSLTSNENAVYVGECVLVDWALNVNVLNKAPISFTNLDKQVPTILDGPFDLKSCWRRNRFVTTIEPIQIHIGNEHYISYSVDKEVYCPTQVRDLQFPSVSLKILKRRYTNGSEMDTIQLSSKPLAITVKALPSTLTNVNGSFLPVGKFTLKDSVSANSVVAGKPFLYSITLQGEGNTFPIEPPRLSSMNVEANLIDITYTDTLIDDNFYSTKSFLYSMKFNKEGTYQLDKNVVFAYFNPTLNKLVKLQSKKTIVVESSVEKNVLPKSGLYNIYPKMILLDVSESMLMEDYQPNRLEATKHGVRDFLTKRKSCDIGLIGFTGGAKLMQISKPDSCYSYILFKDISFNYFPKTGTAIGDAIWLGCHALKKTPNPIMVVIGDGENNSGICPLSLAISHAKKYGIKVYTIGIGTKGYVPLGHDAQGRPMIYANTFVDKDLKQISLQTGGKYLWAKDDAAITSILKIIFPE